MKSKDVRLLVIHFQTSQEDTLPTFFIYYLPMINQPLDTVVCIVWTCNHNILWTDNEESTLFYQTL